MKFLMPIIKMLLFYFQPEFYVLYIRKHFKTLSWSINTYSLRCIYANIFKLDIIMIHLYNIL